jgi:diacylglycerol kinase family enzyme
VPPRTSTAADRLEQGPAQERAVAVLLNAHAWAARKQGIETLQERVRAACAAEGLSATIARVRPEHVEREVRAALARGAARVVVGGGDGSVRMAAQVLADSRTVLGILPLGHFNHCARDLGIAVDLEAAVRTVAHGEVRHIDLGDLDGRAFVNNSVLGVYPHLVRARQDHERRLRLKPLWALLRALWRTFWRFPVLELEVRRPAGIGRLRSPLVFVGNNEYLLGPRIGQREALDGGTLWLCAVKPTGRFAFVRLLLRSLLFATPHESHLLCSRVEDVTIDLGRRSAWVSLDGEVEQVRGRLSYRVRPGALRVLVPPAPPQAPVKGTAGA